MAEKKEPNSKSKKQTPSKKNLTVRERAAASAQEKPKRIRSTAGKIKTPLKKAGTVGKKEYHLPLPDNKAGRVLQKRVRFIPKFVSEAFQEIQLVTWPTPKETIRLSLAVFIFAVVFASVMGLLDFGLGELFQKFIVKS